MMFNDFVIASVEFHLGQFFFMWDSTFQPSPRALFCGESENTVPDVDETLKQWRKEARDKWKALGPGL